MLGKLKNQIARKLATLTNTRRRALVILNARGSRTQVTDPLKDLDTALAEVTKAHHELMELMDDEEQKKTTQRTYEEAANAHQTSVENISAYQQDRKDEPPSVASQAVRAKSEAC